MDKLASHQTYMQLATTVGMKSHCIKKQVGVVIVKEGNILSTGYNCPPGKVSSCQVNLPEKGCQESLRGGCFLSIHAEQNAIVFALKNDIDLVGSTLYVTLAPCLSCAKLILGVGIREVLFKESYAAYKNLAYDEGVKLLNDFSVITRQYAEEVASSPS